MRPPLFPSPRSIPRLSLSRILPIRRYSQRPEGVTAPPGRFGVTEWVLARSLTRFRRFELGHIPRTQAVQALALQIEQWSPYPRTGHYIARGPNDARVWIWDADRLARDFAAHQLSPRSVRVIPESLLHPEARSEARIVRALDGFEGQIWQDGALTHSRWWAQEPDAGEWLDFRRDAGLPPDVGESSPPPPLTPTWTARPWADNTGLTRSSGGFAYEAWLIAAGVLLLGGMTAWEGLSLIRIREATAALRQAHDTASENARPLLEARQQAFDARTRIDTLHALAVYPEPLGLLADVARQMPNDSLQIREWDYSAGKLKITFAAAGGLSTSFMVKKIQDIPGFRNVQALPANDPTVLTLTMEVRPRREMPPPAPVAETMAPPEERRP